MVWDPIFARLSSPPSTRVRKDVFKGKLHRKSELSGTTGEDTMK